MFILGGALINTFYNIGILIAISLMFIRRKILEMYILSSLIIPSIIVYNMLIFSNSVLALRLYVNIPFQILLPTILLEISKRDGIIFLATYVVTTLTYLISIIPH